MITIALDPNLHIGSLTIAWHGLTNLLAVAVGVWVPARLARGAGLISEQLYSLALWAVPGGIVGARLTHVIDSWSALYARDFWAVFALWNGGLGLYGAIIGGALTGVAYAKARGLPLGRTADLCAFGLICGQIVGRIGCAINGDAYGTPTTLPWGLLYTHPDAFAPPGVPGHPAPVYEMLWDALVLAALWRWRGRLKMPGALFYLYLALYALGRFFITFVRGDRVIFLGLQQAHIISLALLLLAVPAFIILWRRGRGRVIEAR